MKWIVNKKTYNTKTATLVAKWDNGLGIDDFNALEEGLYLSPAGQWFIHYWGGANTKYANTVGGYSISGSGIKIIDKDRAYDWLEHFEKFDTLEQYFGDEIEEG